MSTELELINTLIENVSDVHDTVVDNEETLDYFRDRVSTDDEVSETINELQVYMSDEQIDTLIEKTTKEMY